jgi:hypothetical protein
MNQPSFPAVFPFHTMEVQMNTQIINYNYSAIDAHIRRARLARSVALGELVSTGIRSTWDALTRVGQYVRAHAETLARTPDSFSTSFRRP